MRIVLVFVCALSMSAIAQIPRTISFQGVLTDQNGTLLPDGNHQVRLQIYSAPTGGTALFNETHTLPVLKGVFNSVIGSVTPLPGTLDFGRAYFLGIVVDGGAELIPRTAFTAVPYAMRAERAGVADGVANNAITTQQLAEGAVTQSKLATNISIPLSGAAGGDLTGTYPNPSIADNAVTPAKINHASATNGQVLGYVGSTVAWITAPTGGATLDQAYDFGGAGAGRTIVADAGALQVDGTDGFVATGTEGSGTIPLEGSGARMMWYPKAAAFRAGSVSGTQWNSANIGAGSVALGIDVSATAMNSVAIGDHATARGNSSVALGSGVIAGGDFSFATGLSSSASGGASTAMGFNAIASGNSSTSLGYANTASGDRSVAFGAEAEASGEGSMAFGQLSRASGDYSTAMGNNASTAGFNGAFVIGDNSTPSKIGASSANQLTMRFNGGFRLYSSSNLGSGVYMSSGISGWTNVCDRNCKEAFAAVDGEALLGRIREIPITEWSYKNSDPAVRYIGPMAQDFHRAFQLGGADSLGINSIAIDGVNMAAIQALEKRTSIQQATIDAQQTLLGELRDTVAVMRTELLALRRQRAEASTLALTK